MAKVVFDYVIRLSEIESNKINLDIENLDIDGLKGIANGKIFIFFESKRQYIILETGIIDYLIQFKQVINEISNNNFETFSVSCDWYSNSLNYIYNKEKDVLKIKEVNSNLFDIEIEYFSFKKALSFFYKKTIDELLKIYPKLINNSIFDEVMGKDL